MLELKELTKLDVSQWVLTATGNSGFAVNLKHAAKEEGVHLQAGSVVKPGERVYISITSNDKGLTQQALDRLKDQCVRLLDAGVFLIADNENNAMRSYNRYSEGELFLFLKSKGYMHEDKEMYAEWYLKGTRVFDTTIDIAKGPGNTLEYHAKQSEFFQKFANRDAYIRFGKDSIKFINFCSMDIEKLNDMFKGKLINKEGDNLTYIYKPDTSKYNKTPLDVQRIVEYIRNKGLTI
jgi:hypothetical protein